MATPQDLTTTVSGRRCTRSRARTAATSSTLTSSEPPPVTTSSMLTTSTTSVAPQIRTSAAEPPPPLSTLTTTSSTQAAASSTIGTSSAVFPSQAQSVKAQAASSVPAAAAPIASEVNKSQSQTASAAAEAITAPPPVPAVTTSATTPSSDTSIAATSSSTSSSTSSLLDSVLASTSVAAVPDTTSSAALPSDDLSKSQPGQSRSSGLPTGGSAAGIIGSDQGTMGGGNGLTLPASGQTNVAGIAGGVVGGFIGVAVMSALLLFCLRRRKTATFEKWQRTISEKSPDSDGPFAKMKETVKTISVGFGLFFAKIKGKKAGPVSNPYRQHSVRSSVSSFYSVHGPARRSQSTSKPPSNFRQQLHSFSDRMPILKRWRTPLHEKQDSIIMGNPSPISETVEDPVLRNSNTIEDPFKDPAEQPKNLLLLNRGPRSGDGPSGGLQDQQRGPLTPKPAAVPERASRDPFASILDELDEGDGSGTPNWFRDNVQKHKRTTSVQTALRSHPLSDYPPSNYTASVHETPFSDPTDAPPVPSQPLPPNPPSRPANTYAPMPTFNAISSMISRESDVSFFFGEPGPSRPSTNMFGNKVRQSDPFDLDRPEVLSFGNVGGRTIRGSTVTRQSSRKRGSSVPNWIDVSDGTYERANAVPTPFTRDPSARS